MCSAPFSSQKIAAIFLLFGVLNRYTHICMWWCQAINFSLSKRRTCSVTCAVCSISQKQNKTAPEYLSSYCIKFPILLHLSLSLCLFHSPTQTLCLFKANYIQSTHWHTHPYIRCIPNISESLRHLYVSLKLIFWNEILERTKCFETCCDKLRIKRTEHTKTQTHTCIASGIVTVSNDKCYAMNEWAYEWAWKQFWEEDNRPEKKKEWNKSIENKTSNGNSNKGYTKPVLRISLEWKWQWVSDNFIYIQLSSLLFMLGAQTFVISISTIIY